ncbi:prephenate/arogenate dehydrogenase [Moorena producens JHB]|uniref:Prephenate/arogenate dehydrogenase n=1 Tax=Moorena producens (strain JHB) TaxID=1454205 RepID=A0A1D9G1H0_MOOP1|nr:prephenate/arogenate dehydrogenase [Moorena producens]AOY81270.1 prephenate/arogenate dehydrogenase [Moorena producens JHB]
MKIGIVGLGLMGGSLALDLRAQGHQVLGVSRQPKTCQFALDHGIVDDASIDLSILATAEVVFICTPIAAIASTVKHLVNYLYKDTVITDIGSVKMPVVRDIAPLWENFVGGHPMSGTEHSGVEAAVSNLFVGNPYVLTPIETTPPPALQKVEEIVRSLKSLVYITSPENHDQAVAWISHLPVMVSGSLIDACMQETDPVVLSLAQQLASSGFRDTSRVGGGNPELGVMMARYNQESIMRSLLGYRDRLDQIIEVIEQEDWSSLETIFETTQVARKKFVS